MVVRGKWYMAILAKYNLQRERAVIFSCHHMIDYPWLLRGDARRVYPPGTNKHSVSFEHSIYSFMVLERWVLFFILENLTLHFASSLPQVRYRVCVQAECHIVHQRYNVVPCMLIMYSSSTPNDVRKHTVALFIRDLSLRHNLVLLQNTIVILFHESRHQSHLGL